MTALNGEEKTEVVYGEHNVIRAELQLFLNSKQRIDTYMNYTRPQLAMLLEPIKKAFLGAKGRGLKLRYVTEITEDNISACEELMTIVDELRHLNGIKGNFMVSESEYLAPIVLFEKGKVASQIIYSNVREIVEQQQYIFDSFWTKAIPAQEKIREIEEGVVPIRTILLEDQDEVIKEIKRLNNSANKLSICSVFGGMQMSYNYFFDSYKRIVDSYQKGKGDGLRWILNIDKDKDKDSIKLIKKFLESGIQVRHIKEILPMNFGVSDKEVALTIEKMEGGMASHRFLISNDSLYVSHFNSVFEDLWKNGIDAIDQIKAIEQGLEPEFLEVITDRRKAGQILVDLAKSVNTEALSIMPNAEGMLRMQKLGVIDHLIAASQKGASVKIICPLTDSNSHIVKRISDQAPNVKLTNGYEGAPAGVLIADSEKFLQAEIRNPQAVEFAEAIGFAIYSNSKRNVISFKSFFELLWNERIVNEELKRTDAMQREFINIAAHELKTPIQPILGLTEVLRSQIKDVKQRELLEITIRNAKRLQRLTNDILNVTKIESRSLELNKEYFNLNDVVINAINDVTLGEDFHKNENLKLSYNPQDISIQADKEKITQVISNLLSNAIKFTTEGTILVSIEKKKNNNSVIVSVKDSGRGIDSTMFPRLFTKFESKSHRGTGLGLFISKGIIEAHGGKIWGENNPDARGATFSFSLPTAN